MIPDSFSLNLHFTTIRLIAAVYNTVHAGLQVLLHFASLKIPFETLLRTFHDELWTVPHVVFLHILVDKHSHTELTSFLSLQAKLLHVLLHYHAPKAVVARLTLFESVVRYLFPLVNF